MLGRWQSDERELYNAMLRRATVLTFILDNRCIHLHPRRVLPRGHRPAACNPGGIPSWPHWQERLRFRIRFRCLYPPWNGCVCVRRGDLAHRVPGGQTWKAASKAAVPCCCRSFRMPKHCCQRRNHRSCTNNLQARRKLVCRLWTRAKPRHETLLHLRPQIGRAHV